MKKNFIRGCLWALLGLAYLFLSIFGFLSGMFSESLIGSTHPMADVLADVIAWFGVVVGLAPLVCAMAACAVRKRPVVQRVVLAVPFILLMIQLALGFAAEIL